MKEIELSRGMTALVDDEDFEYINQFKWSAHKDGKTKNTFYATGHGKRINGKRASTSIHMFVMGKKQGFVIDHIDGNGLNNQKSNLRFVTHRGNGQNLHIEKS